MIRSRLNNCFNKNRTDENWSLYKTQSNFCTEFFKFFNSVSGDIKYLICHVTSTTM